MRRFGQVLTLIFLSGAMAATAPAQRPRSVSSSSQTGTTAGPTPPPAPQTVKAKYEGGVFGHTKTKEGTLTFDDTNRRLLFRANDQKEEIFFPYDAITSAFADTKSRRPAAATAASAVPLIYTFPAGFIKHKVHYLTLQFSDPDTHVAGVTSFRLDNKDMVASVLNTLAQKAGLTPRGQVYVKRKDEASTQ